MRTIALAAAAVLALAACAPTDADPNLADTPSASGKPAQAKKAKSANGLHTVVYEIGGTARKGLITYSTPSGQEQANGAKVPWTKTFKAKGGEILQVSAQNDGGGTITCKISVDGKMVKKAQSSGQFAIASCDGMLGL